MKQSKLYACCFTLMLFFTGTQTVLAQKTFKDFFNTDTEVTYLGVDFTEVKIAGLTDYDLRDMNERHFSTINNLVITEQKKYDFSKFFHRNTTLINIVPAEEHNKKIETAKLASGGSTDENRFTQASIDKLVKGYGFHGKQGIGVLLIAEAFSKTQASGTIHVAWIDMGNGKVIHTEKFTEKAGGIGMRNYWAKVVYNTLDEMGDKYNQWRKANGK